MRTLIFGLVLAQLCGWGWSEELHFNSQAAWSRWQIPPGLVQINEAGKLSLTRFRKEINAVADAHRFVHTTQERGDAVSGGIWAAGNNAADAGRAIDGDESTFWRLDQNAELKDWFIDIDLGRGVLARHIRLKFPDRDGARPLRQFSVFATTGARIQPTSDLFQFEPVFRTTLPNTANEVLIPLSYPATDTVVVVDPGMEADLAAESRYQVIQYISIVAEEKNPDAALAEVEVLAVGDNISIGANQRGSFTSGRVAAGPEFLFDADLNTTILITSGRGDQGWEGAGTWFHADLGAVFFVEELFLYVLRSWEGTSGSHRGSAGPGHRILFSDGTRTIGSDLPVPEPLDYTLLLTHLEPNADNLYRIRYLFKPRKMRYLFWHGVTDRGWLESKWGEMMLFSSGYPAEVIMRSPFLDLGNEAGDGRPKVIKALGWQARQPPGTRLALRSRAGNQLREEYTFYDRGGSEINEARWSSAPTVLRGPVDTTVVVGSDWDQWSNTYLQPGEDFQSSSPRRFVQLELILSTDHPQRAVELNDLWIEFEDALVSGALGQVEPRRAQANEATDFVYTLWPESMAEDSGFDRVRLGVAGVDSAAGIKVQVGANQVTPLATLFSADGLEVVLPQVVFSDSIKVSFVARLVKNASVIAAEVGLSGRDGVWQSAEPAVRRGNVVLLPQLPSTPGLVGELSLSTQVLTPNGDGVNDGLEVEFLSLKVDGGAPSVAVYDLAGGLVARLEGAAGNGGMWRYSWDGLNTTAGKLAGPGLYLLSIDLGADAGNDRALRLFNLVY